MTKGNDRVRILSLFLITEQYRCPAIRRFPHLKEVKMSPFPKKKNVVIGLCLLLEGVR